jgi:hypothetical protein
MLAPAFKPGFFVERKGCRVATVHDEPKGFERRRSATHCVFDVFPGLKPGANTRAATPWLRMSGYKSCSAMNAPPCV